MATEKPKNNLAGAFVYVSGISTPGHERNGYYGKVISHFCNVSEHSDLLYVENRVTGRIRPEWLSHVRVYSTPKLIISLETHLL